MAAFFQQLNFDASYTSYYIPKWKNHNNKNMHNIADVKQTEIDYGLYVFIYKFKSNDTLGQVHRPPPNTEVHT